MNYQWIEIEQNGDNRVERLCLDECGKVAFFCPDIRVSVILSLVC